jgi:hypothetical protein
VLLAAGGAASAAAANAIPTRGITVPGAAAQNRLLPMTAIVSFVAQTHAVSRRQGVTSLLVAGVDFISRRFRARHCEALGQPPGRRPGYRTD